MFTPKSAEYMKQKEDIIEQLRNLYSEKNEKSEKKRLNQLLHDFFKQEDLNSCNKPIYNLRLDGEAEVIKLRECFLKCLNLMKITSTGLRWRSPSQLVYLKKGPL